MHLPRGGFPPSHRNLEGYARDQNLASKTAVLNQGRVTLTEVYSKDRLSISKLRGEGSRRFFNSGGASRNKAFTSDPVRVNSAHSGMLIMSYGEKPVIAKC